MYSPSVGISFSGAEDVVLVDLAAKLRGPVPRFFAGHCAPPCRDLSLSGSGAGKIQNTHRSFLPQAGNGGKAGPRKRPFLVLQRGPSGMLWHPQSRTLAPGAELLERLGHGPAARPNPSTRTFVPVVQADPTFSTPENALVKFNPLANWSSSRCWGLRPAENDVHNPLHERGFVSSVANPARKRFYRASMNAKAVGGGKSRPRKSAACTLETNCPRQRADRPPAILSLKAAGHQSPLQHQWPTTDSCKA